MKPKVSLRTVGFTGTRRVTSERGVQLLETERDYLEGFNHFVTGGAVGWDAIAGVWCFLTFTEAVHRVILPSNTSQVDPWWMATAIAPQTEKALLEGRLIIDTPADGKTRSYRHRNEKIVGQADSIFYVAEYDELDPHSKRSGTWMTVRIARREGIEDIRGYVLN